MGISKETIATDHEFFYNDFVSQIIFNPPRMSSVEQEVAHCKAILKRSSVVDIRFTNGDAVVLNRVLASKTPIWAVVGGLLSLYVGVSFFSLADTVYLFFKFILTQLLSYKK